MTELEYVIKHGGLTPKQFVKKITRRGFGASILTGLAATAASYPAAPPGPATPSGNDFTIAIIPDPQYLAGDCPNNSGEYYSGMMNWIVENRNIVFTSSKPSFAANIKAVVGVGDCVDQTHADQIKNSQAAWTLLDKNHIAFTTPPGNHDYSGLPDSRGKLGPHFASGYFSAKHRSSAYGSGIDMGGGDMAYWIGSHDHTGANTAVKFVISGTKLLVLAMDFFAGNDAWSWAYGVMQANLDCECYITTHAWLTMKGQQYQRADGYGADMYQMAAAPYSNSAVEAWNTVGVSTWSNLFGIFSGHDIFGGHNSDPASPAWYWQHVPVTSANARGQTVHQVFTNAQQLDNGCGTSVSMGNGTGQIASVFLLSRRPALGLLEGRMIATQTGNWFGPRSSTFPGGTSWHSEERLLFSVPFTGLRES